MEDMKLNKVFSLLLYGESGCGKTAFCQQLSSACSRDLWIVNTSETKSQWFGSSEKLIKKVFDDYAKAVQKEDIAPILLFNEADGIMSARQSNNRGTAISKTENAIASIILQSLEDIDNGSIIIATTNLPENMISAETGGNALSRRFTQKIAFESPSIAAKISILKDRFSTLSENSYLTEQEILRIAEQPLSPGEIDNVVRKIITKQVLTGHFAKFAEIIEYCAEERIKKSIGGKKIGYLQ
jgi:SpoVK/Ycf46/Vps4 family AAA+-type ATPase